MEIKEAISTVQLMKNHFMAFQKIEDFLISTSRYLKMVEDQEIIVGKLKEEIEFLHKQKSAVEGDIKEKKDAFDVKMKEDSDRIIKSATDKAREESDKILGSCKNELAGLKVETEAVKLEIEQLAVVKVNKTAELKTIILDLERQREDLDYQVTSLTSTKDNLKREVDSMKGRLSDFLA